MNIIFKYLETGRLKDVLSHLRTDPQCVEAVNDVCIVCSYCTSRCHSNSRPAPDVGGVHTAAGSGKARPR